MINNPTPSTKPRAPRRTPEEMHQQTEQKAINDFAMLYFEVAKCRALLADPTAPDVLRSPARMLRDHLLPKLEAAEKLAAVFGVAAPLYDPAPANGAKDTPPSQ